MKNKTKNKNIINIKRNKKNDKRIQNKMKKHPKNIKKVN